MRYVVFLSLLVALFSGAHSASAQTACHLYGSGVATPEGFGVPWNTLASSRDVLIKFTCSGSGAQMTVGSGAVNEYIYKFGHRWNGSAWQQFTLSGQELVADTWLVGEGTAQVQGGSPTADTFVVAYVCQWTGSQWKCGCKNSACSTPLWQLQAFRLPVDSPGGSGDDDVTGDVFVIAGAGDIAESGGKQGQTAAILQNVISETPSARIFTLGDNAYPSGSLEQYNSFYAPSWGKPELKSRTYPVPGNHEYRTSGASGYFSYFGAAASKATNGFYVKDLGPYWVGIFMNSEAAIPAQTDQLRNALQAAKNAKKNVVTFWHKPRFPVASKGAVPALQPWWDLMDEFDVDLNLVGHEHLYVRYTGRNKSGKAAADGTRTFLVGSGGAHTRTCEKLPATAQKCLKTVGVIVLELGKDGYNFEFRTPNGVQDSGSGAVVGIRPD